MFVLHSLSPKPADLSSISVDRLQQLLYQITASSFRVGTIEEALLDNQVVAITIDDGYDDITQVWPYLREEKIPITVFIPTLHIGRTNSWDNFILRGKRRHLSKDQIKTLAEQGVSFGSHSHSHVDLTLLPLQKVKDELMQSKRILSELTGKEIKYLAYPFGRSSRQIVTCAKECGYLHGFTTLPILSPGFDVGRIPINKLDNSLSIAAKIRPSILSGTEYLKCMIAGCLSHLTPISSRIKL